MSPDPVSPEPVSPHPVNPDWTASTIAMPGMDCSAEEQLVRVALSGVEEVAGLDVDLGARRVVVRHRGGSAPVLAALAELGMGARLEAEAPVEAPVPGAHPTPPERGTATGGRAERSVLVAVLAINAAMFLAEIVAGILAESTGLVADSLDMLADAAVYGIALAAVGGAQASRRRSARASGWLQLALAGLVLAEAARRAVQGSQPEPAVMMAVGALALVANLTCVALLARHRQGGIHLRASWIFTTNDALANTAVIGAGALVGLTGSALPDLVIGTGIAVLIASGAVRILAMSR